LKILLGTNHYYSYTGSETFAYTLALALREAGHEVHLFSPYAAGSIVHRTQGHGVPVFSDLQGLKDHRYDLIHVSHSLVAYETRQVFPDTPLVFQSHGVLPFLEQPPRDDLGIARYLAVSEEVRDHLHQQGVPMDRIDIFRNCVDTSRFWSYADIQPVPKTLLIMSGRMGADTRAIVLEAAKQVNVRVLSTGEQGTICEYPESLINQADIVISLGRGILEALACGRAALVYDYMGGDGLVTPESIDEIQKCNFSGRRFARKYTAQDLVQEINKYSADMGRTNRRLAEERFSVGRNLAALLRSYQRAIQEHTPRPGAEATVQFVANSLRETRNYQSEVKQLELRAYHESATEERRKYEALVQTLHQDNLQKEKELQAIASSRAWKFIAGYYRLRDRLLPPGSLRKKIIKGIFLDLPKALIKPFLRK